MTGMLRGAAACARGELPTWTETGFSPMSQELLALDCNMVPPILIPLLT